MLDKDKGEVKSQYFGHKHPLVFNEVHSETALCSRCGEVMSGPSFSCAECGFYLHKQCAEAPSQINHPYHRDHALCLLPSPYASKGYEGRLICNFCGEEGIMFVYHCSCKIDLHIKCALFTYNFAEKKFGELKDIACKDPSISTENGNRELENAKCFWCWERLFDSVYCSFDGGFNLHKKCVELSFEISYPCHRKHPLILQFGGSIFSCMICQDTKLSGFLYCCLPCNVAIHVACLSPPSIVEDKGHQHQFTPFLRQMLFTCDACGIEGNCVPYMCSNCNLLVHKKCISLPGIIKFDRHEHPIFHTYFLRGQEFEDRECVICLDGVNTVHGSYYCSDCNFVVHVNCVLELKKWYHVIESDEKLDDDSTSLSDNDSFTVIERNEGGEATRIKHFSHAHSLLLSDKILEDDKYCDGCILSISDSFYYCSQCDFFLHKTCVEFPKKKRLWFRSYQKLFILVSDYIFRCYHCRYVCNGFAYKLEEWREFVCLRCVIPDVLTCQGHEHPLSFVMEHGGPCNACGDREDWKFYCKRCNFALDWKCVTLPHKVRHKCDEHLLTLTYHENNNYSKYHFCDICEKYRNPSHWFYYCEICDNSAHPECALGRYSFIKLGTVIRIEDHPHSLAFVKKMYYYPKCSVCGHPCQDLALECVESGCEYIVDGKCAGLDSLAEWGSGSALLKNDINIRKLREDRQSLP
ncbi:uncharacterized protein LOC111318099 [Durio zibethinus]|uniref:Uncharacterized protein LOC111318099 n=1 Tax=Durio zibethinus TaxID=66656 RepID=A0A6P6BHB5_DURZI|nr:uncharacterized protein LOC111318099 [Durio zibethinus]